MNDDMKVIAHNHVPINMQTFVGLTIFKALDNNVSVTLAAEYVYPTYSR